MKIIDVFQKSLTSEGFSITPTLEEIQEKGYSFASGQYFDIAIDYIELSEIEFATKIGALRLELKQLFDKGKKQEATLNRKLDELTYYEKI